MAEQLKPVLKSTIDRYGLLTPHKCPFAPRPPRSLATCSSSPLRFGFAKGKIDKGQAKGQKSKTVIMAKEAEPKTEINKAYLNHMQFWQALNKTTVHGCSKKLLSMPELYASFSLALTCASCQTPSYVKSKMSVAAFKMMRGSVLGSRCALRGSRQINFCYKWSFLAPSADFKLSAKASTGVGLNNIFVFELDILDYDAFEPLPGLELSFDLKS
jgi:ribosomal protein L5